MKITIEVDEEQAKVIINSLELMARISMGQFEGVYITLWLNGSGVKNSQEVREMLKQLKRIIFPDLSETSYYGILSKEASEPAKIAWDMYQVIRNKMSWAKHPEGGHTVDFNEPMKVSEICELPKVSVKDV